MIHSFSYYFIVLRHFFLNKYTNSMFFFMADAFWGTSNPYSFDHGTLKQNEYILDNEILSYKILNTFSSSDSMCQW